MKQKIEALIIQAVETLMAVGVLNLDTTPEIMI